MTQVEYQASQAEERSQETRSFVRQVRAATRRKYTPEDLCRREGIKPHSYYAWTKEFMEAGKERLTRDSVRDATRQEIEQLKRENSELKQLVGELSLESGSLAFPGARIIGGGGGTGRVVGRVRKELRGPGIACV